MGRFFGFAYGLIAYAAFLAATVIGSPAACTLTASGADAGAAAIRSSSATFSAKRDSPVRSTR